MHFRLFIGLLLLPPCLLAQADWEVHIGELPNDRVFRTACVAPVGIYAGGYAELPPDGVARPLLSHYDTTGLQWRTELDTGIPGWITALHPLPSGVLVSLHQSGRNGALLARFSDTGGLLDTLHLPGEAPIEITNIIADGSGGFYLGGAHRLPDRSTQFYVARLDQQLALRWQHSFARSGTSGSCNSLTLLPDGDLLAGGRLGNSSLYRLTPTGELRWGHPYATIDLVGTLLHPDGRVLIYGGQQRRPRAYYLDVDSGALEDDWVLPNALLDSLSDNSALLHVHFSPDGTRTLLFSEHNRTMRALAVLSSDATLLYFRHFDGLARGHFMHPGIRTATGYAAVGYQRNQRGVPMAIVRFFAPDGRSICEFGDGAQLASPYIAGSLLKPRPGGYAVLGSRVGAGSVIGSVHLALLDATGRIDSRLDWENGGAGFLAVLDGARTEAGWWILYRQYTPVEYDSVSLHLLFLDHAGRMVFPSLRLRPPEEAENHYGHQIDGRVVALKNGSVVVYDRRSHWLLDATGTLLAHDDYPTTARTLSQVDVVALADGNWVMARTNEAEGALVDLFDPARRLLHTRTFPVSIADNIARVDLVQLTAHRLLLHLQYRGTESAGTTLQTHYLAPHDLSALDGRPLNGLLWDPVWAYCSQLARPTELLVNNGQLWASGGAIQRYNTALEVYGSLGTDDTRTCQVDALPGVDNRQFVALHQGGNGYRVVPNGSPSPGTGSWVSAYSLEINERPLDYTKDSLLLIYPNPADEWLHADVVYPAETPPFVDFRLVDASGKTWYRRTIEPDSRWMRHRISVGALPAGMYFLWVNEGGETRTMPVVVK